MANIKFKIIPALILLAIIFFFFCPWFPGSTLMNTDPVSAIELLLNMDQVDIPFLDSYTILRMMLMIPLFSVLLLCLLYMGKKQGLGHLFFLVFIGVSVLRYHLDLAEQFYAVADNVTIKETYGFRGSGIFFGIIFVLIVISHIKTFKHFVIIAVAGVFSLIVYHTITTPVFQSELFRYLADNLGITGLRTMEHLKIVFTAMSMAILSGIPIGIYISRHEKAADIILYMAGILITIPSIALFGFMMPVLSSIDRAWDAVEGIGIGTVPAVIALALYSLLPIIRNTYIAIKHVDPATIEAGNGMGMTRSQLLFRLQLPLAAPIIMAGIRTAVVMGIAIAAIAAFIGAGGLGLFVAEGLQMATNNAVITGAVMMSLLAVVADLLLGKLENWLTPEGVKLNLNVDMKKG